MSHWVMYKLVARTGIDTDMIKHSGILGINMNMCSDIVMTSHTITDTKGCLGNGIKDLVNEHSDCWKTCANLFNGLVTVGGRVQTCSADSTSMFGLGKFEEQSLTNTSKLLDYGAISKEAP